MARLGIRTALASARLADARHNVRVQHGTVMLLGALRLVRGIMGLIGAPQVCEPLLALSWFENLEDVTAPMVVVPGSRLVLGILGLTLFFWLRRAINNLHARKHGVPHPALPNVWNLQAAIVACRDTSRPARALSPGTWPESDQVNSL